jgi:hypothetical protein
VWVEDARDFGLDQRGIEDLRDAALLPYIERRTATVASGWTTRTTTTARLISMPVGPAAGRTPAAAGTAAAIEGVAAAAGPP